MSTIGYKELDRKLRAMSASVGGKVLRSAAFTAMLPALKAAQAAAPVGNPPYFSSARTSIKTGRTYQGRMTNPYPTKTYKGRYKLPGFAAKNIGRKSFLSRDKRTAVVMLAPRKEAFYAINFYEFGTSRNPGRPWLEPSFRASAPAVDERLRAQLKSKIDKAAKS